MPSNAFFRYPTETEKNRVFRVRKKWDGKWDGANKSVNQSFKNSFEAYTFPFTSTAK